MPTPSHLDAWFEAEGRRDPDWRDYFPPDVRDPEVSPTRLLWDALAAEMHDFDRGVRISGARLRNHHTAGRSVIWPRRALLAPPHERVTAHVARCKTSAERWQQVALAWLSPQIRDSASMALMIAELVQRCPAGISLVAFTQHNWLAVALAANRFSAISPHDSRLPAGLTAPPHCACYVLERT